MKTETDDVSEDNDLFLQALAKQEYAILAT
jgi:hypothetical protein